MAYEPKTWVCGDDITAEDLNHIERGIANAGGGGGAVYELTIDTTTQCYTLGASYNDLVASGGGVAHLQMEVSGSLVDIYVDILEFYSAQGAFEAWLIVPTDISESTPIIPMKLSATSADEHFTKCASPTPTPPVG